MQPLLSIRHASKHYGGTPALIDAALDLLPGEIHALMGENGAGKSTLIKLLAGVTTADHIEVTLRGQPIQLSSAQAVFDHGLRFIHQELNSVPQLSAAENLLLSQRYPRRLGLLVDWPQVNARARAALARLGVEHIDPREKMARLSVGDQMLVKIAGALTNADEASGGRVYVLDEPTAALTGAESERLFAALDALKAQGAAILYVSHRMDEIFRISDRITVMRDGRVIETQPTASLSPARVIALMTGRTLEQAYPPQLPLAADDATPRLVVRSLTTRAVRSITFTLAAGEILGVAGLQGAGRSELLRALSGADRAISGEMRLSGRESGRLGLTSGWRGGIASIPEERRAQGLLLSRSIRDNVTLPHLGSVSHGGLLLDRAAETRLTRQMGAAVRLKAQGPAQRARELSGGNQQKVLFARALAQNPTLLLLDEPTRGVDVGAKYDIYSLVREAAARGAGIVLASSDLGELIGMCDRILILRGGEQAALVPAAGLTQGALLALCYGETP